MKERRLVPRVPCRCPVEVRSGVDCCDVTLSYAVELSMGGCFVRSNRHQTAGTPLEVVLSLEDGSRVEVQGVVLYDGKAAASSAEPGQPGFAVGFVVIERGSAARLRDYLIARGAGPPRRQDSQPPRQRSKSGTQARTRRARKSTSR
ncbi:MAG: PilZ domain-containing protein [Deltaproteobacteria bacterium]|nr:PilZ domain-containing protein [Deltaproteobacteria bacterium]